MFNFTGNAQQAGGSELSLFSFSPTNWTALYWGSRPAPDLPTAGLDGSPHALIAAAIGVQGEDLGLVTLSYQPGEAAPTDAGTYVVNATFAGNANYEPVTGSATLTITAVEPTVTITGGEFRATLKKTAIDKNALGIALHKKARPSHSLGCTEELYAEHGNQERKRSARQSAFRKGGSDGMSPSATGMCYKCGIRPLPDRESR